MPKKTRKRKLQTQAEKIEYLMNLTGLEMIGFAEFVGISESHLYALINGTRKLTVGMAKKIALPFNIEWNILLDENNNITNKKISTVQLKKFYTENKGVRDYFVHTRRQRKVSYFIENEILVQQQFDTFFYVTDVRRACLDAGMNLESKRISQVLNYLVELGKLKRKRGRIILKNGSFGKRVVDIFSKNLKW
jgi:plasmid maintenance system antidote protein VapI